MIIKGDKIKLVSKIGDFNEIGDIFEVTGVNNGVVSFKCDYGTGCMSYDEFEKYFEKLNIYQKNQKRDWSEWKTIALSFRDIYNVKIHININYRTNDKSVQIKFGSLKAKATCHYTDDFDLAIGLDLATKRFIVKYLSRQVKLLSNRL